MKRTSFLCILAVVTCLPALAQEVNIGSYNIRNHNKGDYNHDDGWRQRRDVLCGIFNLCDFDAFGAQEVNDDQIRDILERCPDFDFVGVGRDDGAKGGEYSPVFYRKDKYVALKSGTFWLSETPDTVSYGWDAQCRRVCSYVQLRDRKTRQQFWFFNTHLDHIGIVARREAVKLIVAKVHELAGDKANVVITGDFNVDQFSEPHATMLGSGRLVDSYDIAKYKFAPGGTFNDFIPAKYTEQRIDHIFVGAGSKVSRYGILLFHYWSGGKLGDTTLSSAPGELKAEMREIHLPSDHYPICAKVTFPRKR